ncbi:hypothetical protein CBR_g37113 [Chara braunii]|uniref:Ammonium transporter n=1 Tax=Chara braunii TaxID=69332 RepID=A0A388LM49_CHABU|nr:hypothetical protein CBR_g37113 [Chara braunii]|eukprot:GBG83399.1 hypothetical protein CBR_g37113 [Chara braunii]
MALSECNGDLLRALDHIGNASNLTSFAMEEVTSYFCELDNRVNYVTTGTDTTFLLFSAYLVFVMQAGFCMYCAGSVKDSAQNTLNIIVMNVVDAAVSAIAYYLFGFALAYGEPSNGFIGKGNFAHHDFYATGQDGYAVNPFANHGIWIYEWASAAVVAGIASGSIAGRSQVTAYVACSAFLTGFVYPVISHWAWATYGWLNPYRTPQPFLKVGMADFGGSGAIHMTGGIAGFWGAWIEGPRRGRGEPRDVPQPMNGHSTAFVVLGTLLLWLGWYGFNPGSDFDIVPATDFPINVIVERAAVTTTLAGAAGGLTMLFVRRLNTREWEVEDMCSGVIGGLVAVSAGCGVIESWAAVLLGFLGAWVLIGMKMVAMAIRLDDPVESSQRHFGCGLLGLLFVAFFAKKEYAVHLYGDNFYGIVYGGSGRVLAAQAIGALCTVAWTSVTMAPFFFVLHQLGLLRMSAEEFMGRRLPRPLIFDN